VDEQCKARIGADRIAGQAENQRAAAGPEEDRLSRFHFDLMKMGVRAQLLQNAWNKVKLARRDAAGQDEHVLRQARADLLA
jgi:hypothetical protein